MLRHFRLKTFIILFFSLLIQLLPISNVKASDFSFDLEEGTLNVTMAPVVLSMATLVQLVILADDDPEMFVSVSSTATAGGIGVGVTSGVGAGVAASSVTTTLIFIWKSDDFFSEMWHMFKSGIDNEEYIIYTLKEFEGIKQEANNFLAGLPVSDKIFDLFDFMDRMDPNLVELSDTAKAMYIVNTDLEIR